MNACQFYLDLQAVRAPWGVYIPENDRLIFIQEYSAFQVRYPDHRGLQERLLGIHSGLHDVTV